ncbi:MAG: acyl-CoA dehydrogenase family protein [Alphaproteobacteria bacterium]|nr:acyl-CoA dehydrogenase family protein [Alphaproteobacteria bacterium]
MDQSIVSEKITVTREDVLARARALLPVVTERSEKATEERRLPEENVRDFLDAGLFQILQPKRVGGLELDFGMLVEVSAVISSVCASSGWNVSNIASHHWMLAMWPKEAQDAVWGKNGETADTLICASVIFPAGRAKRVDGGYLLSGRWPFCSGIDPSEWNMLGGMVEPDDDHPKKEARMFLMRKSEHEVIDTWFTSGLQGTGSKDSAADEVFVPEHMTVAADDVKGGPTPGSIVNPGALYQVPVIAPFPYVLTGTPLGIAEGVYQNYVEGMKARTANYTGARIADLQNVQIKVAEAGAAIDAARMMMLADCDLSMEIARRGEAPDLETKAKFRRNGAYTANLCVEAVNKLYQASGGGGIYTCNPLARAFRDIHAARAHIAFNMDVAGTTFGRIAFGLGSDNAVL